MNGVASTVAVAGGIVIVFVTLIDMIRTVLTVSSGHGVISAGVSRLLWRSFTRLQKWKWFRPLVKAAGPAIFVTVTVTWTMCFLLGWMLIFSPADALAAANPTGSVGWLDRIDFATTLILGASSSVVEANGQPWSVIASIGSFNGLVVVSFGLAYALPVVQSVIRFRTLARSIDMFGRQQRAVAEAAERDGADSMFDLFTLNLTTQLVQAAQEVHAYPIVPYFHSPRRESAISPNLKALLDSLDDEDLHSTLPDTLLLPLHKSIDDLLEVIVDHYLPSSIDLPDAATNRDEWREAAVAAWLDHAGWDETDVYPEAAD